MHRSRSILFNGKKNVLWGAGENGKKTLLNFIAQGIYIDFFCDTNIEKQGLRLFNKKIQSPDEILEHSEDYNIIICAARENDILQIEDKCKQRGVSRVLLSKDVTLNFVTLSINPVFLYRVILESDKKIIIYGKNRNSEKVYHILKYVDVRIEFFVEEEESDDLFCDKPVKSIYDLLDLEKNKFLLVLPDNDSQVITKLEKLGFTMRKDFNIFNDFRRELPRKNVLDPNLGYSFVTGNREKPGIIVFGNPASDYKIAILGGSTTDPGLYPFKSWPELLAEKLMIKGIDASVVCAACAGYKSSQELIKLIRDILPMKPDIVIDYTGINDASHPWKQEQVKRYPFVHEYQLELFDAISQQSVCDWNYLKMRKGYVAGADNKLLPWDEFEKNVRCMGAVCKEYGIRYFFFLQPYLGSKERFEISEKELILNTDIDAGYLKFLEDFYEHKQRFQKYIIDMTDIFNDSEVYLDICHVTEEGNRIIADAIFQKVIGGGRTE